MHLVPFMCTLPHCSPYVASPTTMPPPPRARIQVGVEATPVGVTWWY
jgi:hypothetical protein